MTESWRQSVSQCQRERLCPALPSPFIIRGCGRLSPLKQKEKSSPVRVRLTSDTNPCQPQNHQPSTNQPPRLNHRPLKIKMQLLGHLSNILETLNSVEMCV